MKKGYFILLVLALFFMPCCNSQKQNKIQPETNIKKSFRSSLDKDYRTSMRFFPKNLVDHFPSTAIDTNFITYSTNIIYSDNNAIENYSFELFVRCKYYEKDSVFINLIKETCKRISSHDTNSLLIFSYIEEENDGFEDLSIDALSSVKSRKIAEKNKYNINGYPLPLFDYAKENNISSYTMIDTNFTIYAISAKAGIFIDNKYLRTNKYLPKNWLHGYSKGYALNEINKLILYWVVVW